MKMNGVRKSDNNPANHKGSIIRWKKYRYKKDQYDIKYQYGITAIEDGWNEDILLEPMDYQIVVTLNIGLIVLSSLEAQSVELIDADLWDDSCKEKLEEILNKFK